MPCAFIRSAFAADILSMADIDMSDWMAFIKSVMVGSVWYACLIILLCGRAAYRYFCGTTMPEGVCSIEIYPGFPGDGDGDGDGV